jgi:hypothetical protein
MKIQNRVSLLLGWLLIPYALFSYELGIVTLFRNEANYLKEWIEYHHMLGVDHFLLYNDRSDDHWAEVLEPYIKSNLVEVFEWDKPEDRSLFPCWQLSAYRDGIKRSLNNTKWLAFIDVDEFILPKKTATITECLNKYYSSASGVYICWRNFGTNHVYVNPGEPILTRLTAASMIYHSRNAAGKSIVKVDAIDISKLWSPHEFVFKQGAQCYNGSGLPLMLKNGYPKVDPRHTSKYIQINHYTLRDENFYRNVRLPNQYPDPNLVIELYQSYNLIQDFQMVKFLNKYHTEMYRTFWHGKS